MISAGTSSIPIECPQTGNCLSSFLNSELDLAGQWLWEAGAINLSHCGGRNSRHKVTEL